MLRMFVPSKSTNLSASNALGTRSHKTSYRAELNANNIVRTLILPPIFKGRLDQTSAPQMSNLHFRGRPSEKRVPEYKQSHTQTQSIDRV